MAAYFIGKSGKAGIEYLQNTVRNADSAHAEAALSALSEVEPAPDGVSNWLLGALKDDRVPVKWAAIHGLQRLAIKEPVDQIEPLVRHPSDMVRAAAMKYLSWLYPEIAIEYAEALHADPSWIVRDRVIAELDDTEDEKMAKLAVPYALKSLDDPQPYVREDASDLLERIYWEAKSPQELIEGRLDPDPRIRASALRASAHNALDTAPVAIAGALADPERVVRLSALDELFEIYRDNQREPLPEFPEISKWLTDDDPVIREVAEAVTACKDGDTGYYRKRY